MRPMSAPPVSALNPLTFSRFTLVRCFWYIVSHTHIPKCVHIRNTCVCLAYKSFFLQQLQRIQQSTRRIKGDTRNTVQVRVFLYLRAYEYAWVHVFLTFQYISKLAERNEHHQQLASVFLLYINGTASSIFFDFWLHEEVAQGRDLKLCLISIVSFLATYIHFPCILLAYPPATHFQCTTLLQYLGSKNSS
jgi:hypothetical protein